MRSLLGLVVIGIFLTGGVSAWGEAGPDTQMNPRDAFIAGYASAVLERDFHLEPTSLVVNQGVITVTTSGLGVAEKASVRDSLLKVQGVQGVIFVDATRPAVLKDQTNIPRPASPPATADISTQPGTSAVQTDLSPHPWSFLAPTGTFDPLLADPRWPHFFATYDRYT